MQRTIPFLFLLLTVGLFSCEKTDPQPSPDAQTYYYPPLTGGEWETVSPEVLGWDVAKLNETTDWLGANNSTAFIILYKGRIVTEKYWNGWNASTSAEIASATKSMTAFLTGLAQEQGKLSIDDPVTKHLGKGWTKAFAAQENQITIKHLLTMTSGLNEDLTYATDAGTRWYYNTPAYYRTLFCLQAATGKTFQEYTDEQLWSKIGMQHASWTTSGAITMACSGRDMARFGLLVASDLKWNGTAFTNNSAYFTDMLTSSQNFNPAYGYLWWLNGKSSYRLPSGSSQLTVSTSGSLIPAAPADLLSALGKGDKKIYVLKSKDLVVIRHGTEVGDSRQALSSFDNDLWTRLMQIIQ